MSKSPSTLQVLLRAKTFWLSLVFVLYSIFGWLIVPHIVSSQLKEQLNTLAGWQVEVERVRFNPYRLALEVDQLKANDSEGVPVVAWDKLTANYNLLALVGGVIALDEITLVSPYVHLTLDEQGTTNFQKAFVSDASSEETPTSEEDSDPLKLFFGDIRISDGRIDIDDWSQGEEFNLELEPVSLELNNFGTHNNDGGDYSLRLSLGQGQILDWQGQFGVAPFYSRGKIALQNIRSQSFWHYVKDYSPLWLHHALVSIEAQYDTRGQDGISLTLEQGSVRIDQLDARLKAGSEQSILQLEQLTLGPINLSLDAQKVGLGNLILAAPAINLERDRNGELTLLQAFASADDQASDGVTSGSEQTGNDTGSTPATTANTSQTSDAGWQWQLDRFVLNQGTLNWQDDSLKQPATLQLSNIDLALQDINQDLSRLSPYALQFSLAESRHQLKGLLAPQPLQIQGDLTIAQLPLNLAQAYLAESANVQIDAGTLSIDGDYTLNQHDTLKGTINLSLSVDTLKTSDTGLQKPLAGFTRLAIAPIAMELDPLSVAVGELQIQDPYGEIVIDEAGQLNLALLAANTQASEDADNNTESDAVVSETDSTEAEVSGTGVNIKVERITLNQGRVNFSDSSQSPPFSTYLADLNGELLGINSTSPKASELSLSGKVDQFGSLNSQGKLNVFDPAQPSEFKVQVQNINLSALSTYGARYMGYPIDKGKLDLDLDYVIQQSSLKANNHVVVDNLELGKRSKSKDALNLPLPLALAILENTKGVIDIKLPVSGDLNDPGFSLGNVLFTAFTNLLTKAIASPFTILGSIIEGGADLSEVRFEPGVAALSPSENQRLRQLAEALQKRPNLKLEIRGQADRQTDLRGLRDQRLKQALATINESDALAQRAKLAEQWQQQAAFEQLAQKFAQQRGSAEHLNAIDTQLKQSIEVEEVAFLQLAKQRAQAVLKSLSEQHDIATERLFVLEAQVVADKKNSKTVAVPFSLNVR